MQVSHKKELVGSEVLEELVEYVASWKQECQERKRRGEALPDLECFEGQVQARVMELARVMIQQGLEEYEVESEEVMIEGERYVRDQVSARTYLSAAGEVQVERWLYRRADGQGKRVCPLELQAGIIRRYWTPRAARQGALAVALMTPGEAEQWFAEMGHMTPSRASLGRLPATLSAQWEAHHPEWEEVLRAHELVPDEARVVAVSRDGVMLPMRDAQREDNGKRATGPAGFREAGCGTVVLYDQEAERLHTVRWGRMPEKHMATLNQQLEAEVIPLIQARPDLVLVKLADGAKGNWSALDHLEQRLPADWQGIAVEIVDFNHAAEHLKRACDAIFGEGSTQARAEYERRRVWLKDEEGGVDRVIRSLAAYAGRARGRRRQRIDTELTYFKRQRHRMRYAHYQQQHWPIASGVVEAACKTLVTQRLKGSGMRWGPTGGQALLTVRSLFQSDRWERAWPLWKTAFQQPVHRLQRTHHRTLRLVA